LATSDDEKAILYAISRGMTSGEEILKTLREEWPLFDVARFNIAITTLELKGVVKREYGNQWILA
jgi:hypothetical protein